MIYFVTPYGRRGPSSRVRVYEWSERIGISHAVTGYAGLDNSSPATLLRHPARVVRAERRLRRVASERPELLVLHREASPLSRGGLERRLLTNSTFSVYDFDDALQWDNGEGPLFRRLAPKADKAIVAARHAARVIAGNPVLAEWAAGHNRDVVVIPSCVSPSAYTAKTDYDVGETPRLVWIGSVDNEVYLEAIAPALREVHRRTGARVTVISSATRRLSELESLTDRVEWSEETQHSILHRFDVGIAPTPDEPYERGKCGYKLLQYAAAGLPFAASPVGVNARMLEEFGMPAPVGISEWADALVEFLTMSSARRAEVGRAARTYVEKAYSYEAWLPAWQDAVGLPRSAPTAEVVVS